MATTQGRRAKPPSMLGGDGGNGGGSCGTQDSSQWFQSHVDGARMGLPLDATGSSQNYGCLISGYQATPLAHAPWGGGETYYPGGMVGGAGAKAKAKAGKKRAVSGGAKPKPKAKPKAKAAPKPKAAAKGKGKK